MSSLRQRALAALDSPFFADPKILTLAQAWIEAVENEEKSLKVVTWNIAAINNNPFEYWITHEDPAYNELMQTFQNMIDSPAEVDCKMSAVFTPEMLSTLQGRMEEAKLTGVQAAVDMWTADYMDRLVIAGFLKDKLVGSKRLISMGDRVTNTILTSDPNQGPVCRPSIINNYQGDMSCPDQWWSDWQAFMFDNALLLKGKKEAEASMKKVISTLLPIKRAKYKDVTEEEEKVSLPLQTIALAAFDAILLYLMNRAKPAEVWQKIKFDLCKALVTNKTPRTVEVLAGPAYRTSDIIFIQEAALLFCDALEENSIINESFFVLSPKNPDCARNQNSIMLLSKDTFEHKGVYVDGQCVDVTEEVVKLFPANTKVPISQGDLFVVKASDVKGTQYLLASFHGDTNGLASLPVLTAVHAYAASQSSGVKLIFGLDANTYASANKKQQSFAGFVEAFTKLGMSSCWGPQPSPALCTTFNARTYIQPQLNKAVRMADRKTKGDNNPKDFILYYSKDFNLGHTSRDNKGEDIPAYDDDMVFPTMSFPSDHGIVATSLL